VLRWMPGKPRPAVAAKPARDGGYEAELAILENEVLLKSAEREG
jgi:hypothetical protein